MSLHANLTPEARARLQTQRRNSTVSSIAITLLAVILLGLTLGYVLLDRAFKENDAVVLIQRPIELPDPVLQPRLRPVTEHKPAAPSANNQRLVVARNAGPVVVAVAEQPPREPSLYPGEGNDLDIGNGWDGTGPGDRPTGAFQPPQQRCSKADRKARLAATGGTDACEEAVEKALQWLKRTQSKDGGWPGNVANTGFALLAYLGHCETPVSEVYGESCLRAITCLVNLGLNNRAGWLSNNPNPAVNKQLCYEHAINTYALAEATTLWRMRKQQFGVIDIPDLEAVTRRAGQLIIDNQTAGGGWEYGYAETSNRGGGDLSITAWQLQALKACKLTGLDFRNLMPCVKRSLDHVTGLAGGDGGFGYAAPGKGHADYLTLTGAGMLCLQIWGKESAATVRAAARYVERNTRFEYNSRFADLYGHYYEAQAMLNRGGEQWRRYNALFRDELLRNQAADGSWKVPGGGGELRAVAPAYTSDATYRTCLCTLMLEVYYRFLPTSEAR